MTATPVDIARLNNMDCPIVPTAYMFMPIIALIRLSLTSGLVSFLQTYRSDVSVSISVQATSCDSS